MRRLLIFVPFLILSSNCLADTEFLYVPELTGEYKIGDIAEPYWTEALGASGLLPASLREKSVTFQWSGPAPRYMIYEIRGFLREPLFQASGPLASYEDPSKINFNGGFVFQPRPGISWGTTLNESLTLSDSPIAFEHEYDGITGKFRTALVVDAVTQYSGSVWQPGTNASGLTAQLYAVFYNYNMLSSPVSFQSRGSIFVESARVALSTERFSPASVEMLTLSGSGVSPPEISFTLNGFSTPIPWYRENISVNWLVDMKGNLDFGREGCSDTIVSTDTTGIDVACRIKTWAGITDKSITIKRDATAPVATAAPSPLPNSTGWNNTVVSVAFSGTDATSGIASCSDSVSIMTEGNAQTSATGTCMDNAGNVSAAASYSPINIDLTPPVVTADRTPIANAAGWNNTPVVASFTGLDSLSGVAVDGCSSPILLNTSGSAQSASGGCTDLAGNTATASVSSINIDLIAPVASATVTPASNAANWHKSAVTVSFDGTDSLSGSGLAVCSSAGTVTTDGAAQVRSGTCSDVAGNISNMVGAVVNLDTTAPSMNVTAPTSGGNYVQNSVNNASYSCTDALSGITGCLGTVPSGSAFSTSNAGVNTFTVQATDLAGNTASRSVSYTITALSPFTLAPSTLAFGDRLTNSSTALAVTIRNTSAASLALTAPSLAGTNANQFTLARTCRTSLAANASCTVTATFRPTTAGAKTASFSIRIGTVTQTVALSGTGVAVAFAVSPTSIAFANQTRNTTGAAQPVTVTNQTSLPVTLSTIALGGTNANQFVLTRNCGTTLAASSTCTVSVAFRPTSAGAKRATLTVTPSGATAKTVALTGTGL